MSHIVYRLHQSNRSFYKKRFRLALLFTIASIIMLALLSIYFLSNLSNQNSQSAIGKKIIGHISGPKLFKNQFFEFYSSDDWTYDAHDSTPSEIMYLLHNDGVVSGSLEVYINQQPINNNLQATRVVPAKVNGNQLTDIGAISGPCGQVYPPNALQRIKEVSIDSTSMLCVPDSSQYEVIVGSVGGNYNLKMLRSNGQIASYIILYRSLSFTPDGGPLESLLPTFKSL